MRLLQAIKNKICVEIIKETQSPGGLYVPVSESEPHRLGKVVSVGEEVTGVAVGDVLAFAKHGGQATILNGTHFMVLIDSEIFGKVIDLENE